MSVLPTFCIAAALCPTGGAALLILSCAELCSLLSVILFEFYLNQDIYLTNVTKLVINLQPLVQIEVSKFYTII
jgi:hypothetical protein